MVKRTIHIMHSSLLFSNSLGQLTSDLQFAFSKNPDVIGVTEAGASAFKRRITEAARNNGYTAVLPRGESGVLVRKGGPADSRVTDRGSVFCSSGVPNVYPARYIVWAKFSWYGEKVYLHNGHWPSGIGKTYLATHKLRISQHAQQTRIMAGLVRRHGAGEGISFFSGDINKDEGEDNRQDFANMPNQIFRENGLRTIWDEFGVVPRPTLGGSVFDIVGSFRPDNAVVGKRYQVWPKQNSDHNPVSAWYEVDVDAIKRAGNAGNGGGNSGGGKGKGKGGSEADTKPDPYATGGNVSWKDYRDNTIYDLPYAVDDSDGSNRQR